MEIKEEKKNKKREREREDLLLALGEGLVEDVTVLLDLSDADHPLPITTATSLS